jgi:hypothetical protein
MDDVTEGQHGSVAVLTRRIAAKALGGDGLATRIAAGQIAKKQRAEQVATADGPLPCRIIGEASVAFYKE